MNKGKSMAYTWSLNSNKIKRFPGQFLRKFFTNILKKRQKINSAQKIRLCISCSSILSRPVFGISCYKVFVRLNGRCLCFIVCPRKIFLTYLPAFIVFLKISFAFFSTNNFSYCRSWRAFRNLCLSFFS